MTYVGFVAFIWKHGQGTTIGIWHNLMLETIRSFTALNRRHGGTMIAKTTRCYLQFFRLFSGISVSPFSISTCFKVWLSLQAYCQHSFLSHKLQQPRKPFENWQTQFLVATAINKHQNMKPAFRNREPPNPLWVDQPLPWRWPKTSFGRPFTAPFRVIRPKATGGCGMLTKLSLWFKLIRSHNEYRTLYVLKAHHDMTVIWIQHPALPEANSVVTMVRFSTYTNQKTMISVAVNWFKLLKFPTRWFQLIIWDAGYKTNFKLDGPWVQKGSLHRPGKHGWRGPRDPDKLTWSWLIVRG